MKIFGKELTFNGFDVFHKGNKPTKADVGLSNVENVRQYSIDNPPREAYLGWGGKSLAGFTSPVDAGLNPALGADRFALIKNPDGVVVEYSRDGGATWVDYGSTDEQKLNLFTSKMNLFFRCGKPATGNEVTTGYMLRVTLDMDLCRVYTRVNKLIIYIATEGSNNCYCAVDGAKAGTPDDYITLMGKQHIEGWTGYNVLNFSIGGYIFGGNNSYSYKKIRLTFGHDGDHAKKYLGLSVMKISAYGGFGWTAPSNTAKNGVPYVCDAQENASFPNGLSAKTFNGYTIESSVPKNAKFTDTTYSVFNSGSSGLVPASGGGTAKYLRADGTWQVPPSSGGGGNKVTVSTSEPSAPKIGDIWI